MPTDSERPSLREFLEQAVRYERELAEQRFSALASQHEVQALELARRLDELNHAHATAVAEQARVLPRELFEQFKTDYESRRLTASERIQKLEGSMDGIPDKISDLQTWKNQMQGGLILIKLGGLIGVVAFIMSVARLMGWMK